MVSHENGVKGAPGKKKFDETYMPVQGLQFISVNLHNHLICTFINFQEEDGYRYYVDLNCKPEKQYSLGKFFWTI